MRPRESSKEDFSDMFDIHLDLAHSLKGCLKICMQQPCSGSCSIDTSRGDVKTKTEHAHLEGSIEVEIGTSSLEH